jgi:guanylate kinase
MFDWLKRLTHKTEVQRGKIFFFSGPSGVGKGTLINHIRDTQPEFVFPQK